jgi:hypothetical protein
LKGRLMFVVDRYLPIRHKNKLSLFECVANARDNSPHELEFAVRRNETDCSVRVELAQLDALVKLTIVELNLTVLEGSCRSLRFRSEAVFAAKDWNGKHAGSATSARNDPVCQSRASCNVLLIYHQLVVQTKLAFRSTRQISSHQNLTVDIRSQHST